ncbi:hypothetical protein V0288_00095 [Pannus brasiliensis CCIBt3594]|uniref:PEP-CTERM sorting domain-containing protein n=1 Tax=Pannus brasiliensis CCIBt3594 TaxID=1427578 RepID=A0AAW9QMR4_9CHRO
MTRATMKKALIFGLVFSSVVLGANATLGATQTIDHFTQGFTPPDALTYFDDGFTTPLPLPPQAQTGLSSVLGGARNTVFEILDPGSTIGGDITILEITSGGLDLSVNGPEGNRTSTTVTWNGGGGVSGLGANGNFSAFDRFRLNANRFALNAGGSTNVGTITLRARNSSVAPYASFSQTLGEISSATPIDFLFSSPNFSGVSFNSIYDIQLEVTSNNPGLLFTFDDLEAFSPTTPPPVPEPSLALGCLLLGGTQFAITGWKRYKNSRKN